MADITLEQVREKFPQYKDLSDDQLAQGLHKKYYPDMPFEDFSAKIGYKSKAAPKISISDVMRGKGLPNQDIASGLQAAGEIAKAGGRGLAKFVTTGGGLGEFGLPFLSSQEFEQYVRPYVGKSPEDYQPFETGVELTSALLPFGRAKPISSATEFYATKPQTAEELLTGARSLGEQLTTSARTKAEKTQKEIIPEIEKIIEMKKQMATSEKSLPEIPQIHEAARSETKFAAPDTDQLRIAGKDLRSDIRNLSASKLQEAEKKLAGGGDQFQKYLQKGAELEKTQPVATSEAGKRLQAKLLEMSKNMQLTPETRGLAAVTEKKLFPKQANEAFNTFDVEYRRLMDRARGKSEVRIGPEEAKVLETVAKPVEQALIDFVGKENYARPIYAEEAKDINKFRQDLGEALASREKIDYEEGKGQIVSVRKPEQVLFADRQSVKIGRQLLGNDAVNAFAERHAANELKGKTGAQIKDWLSKNDFVYEVPSLYEKINAFGENVARREGDAKALAALQQQMKDHLKTVGTVADQVQDKIRDAVKIINTSAKQIAKQSPEKLSETWLGVGGAPGMRSSLEQTGLFEKADLDRLEAQLLDASKLAQKEASSAAAQKAIFDFLKVAGKKAGIPIGVGGLGIAAYEAGKSLLGGE